MSKCGAERGFYVRGFCLKKTNKQKQNIIMIKVITIIPRCAEIIDVTSFQHDNGHDDLGHLGVI